MDFTQKVQRCTEFHDSTIGRGAIIRRAFEVIRKAVDDEAYSLACPHRMNRFPGRLTVRITADIQLRGAAVQFNIGSFVCRRRLDRKQWNNATDFMIVTIKESLRYTLNQKEMIPQ